MNIFKFLKKGKKMVDEAAGTAAVSGAGLAVVAEMAPPVDNAYVEEGCEQFGHKLSHLLPEFEKIFGEAKLGADELLKWVAEKI